MESREFTLYTVLALTHRLPCLGTPMQELLEFLGGRHYAGPMAAALCKIHEGGRAWVLETHPELRKVPPCPQFDPADEQGMDDWCAAQAEMLGTNYVTLTPIDENFWKPGDPIESLADAIGPDQIYVIDPENL